jgi:hypothetical protein
MRLISSAESERCEGNDSEESGSGSSDRIAALSALYQAERQDMSSLDTLALALIAGYLAYLGIAAVILGESHAIANRWVLPFLSLPLWVGSSYHVILVAANLARAQSVEIVEHLLVAEAEIEDNHRQKIGFRAIQRVMNVEEQPTVLKLQTFITYIGIFLVTTSFTAYCLVMTAIRDNVFSPEFIAANIVYFLLFLSSVAAWIYVLKLTREMTRDAAKVMK